VTYLTEPHLTERQSGIARSTVARLFYSAFRYLVTRTVLPISIDLVSKVAVASGEEVTATFERVSSYRGGSCRRATAISKNLIVRFRADSFVMKNTHDILPLLMKENEEVEFSYFIFTCYFSRYLYYNRA